MSSKDITVLDTLNDIYKDKFQILGFVLAGLIFFFIYDFFYTKDKYSIELKIEPANKFISSLLVPASITGNESDSNYNLSGVVVTNDSHDFIKDYLFEFYSNYRNEVKVLKKFDLKLHRPRMVIVNTPTNYLGSTITEAGFYLTAEIKGKEQTEKFGKAIKQLILDGKNSLKSTVLNYNKRLLNRHNQILEKTIERSNRLQEGRYRSTISMLITASIRSGNQPDLNKINKLAEQIFEKHLENKIHMFSEKDQGRMFNIEYLKSSIDFIESNKLQFFKVYPEGDIEISKIQSKVSYMVFLVGFFALGVFFTIVRRNFF